VIAGTDPEAPDFPPIRESTDAGQKKFRIAWTDGFPGIQVSKDTQDMMATTARALSDAGYVVEKAQPEALDFSAAREAWGIITGCLMGSGVKPPIRLMLKLSFLLNKDRSDMNRGAVKGLGFKFKHFANALVVRDTCNVHIEQFLQRYDLWLCPVTSGGAFPHAKPGKPVLVDKKKVDYLHACGGHTSLFNFSGHPVAILPQFEPIISGYQPPPQ
jgi:amidase